MLGQNCVCLLETFKRSDLQQRFKPWLAVDWKEWLAWNEVLTHYQTTKF